MGEKETAPFQFTFNGFLKVAFQGSRVTSDAGLILVRELDERLGLDAIITEHLRDSRQGLNTQFRLPDLLRQSVYSRLAGYEDLNDAVRLAADPAFRLIGSPKRWDRSAALTSTLHWFETELLSQISLFAASDLSSAVATAAAIAVFASESNGWRNSAVSWPAFQEQFETRKPKRRRFSRASCFSKSRRAFRASSRSWTPSAMYDWLAAWC